MADSPPPAADIEEVERWYQAATPGLWGIDGGDRETCITATNGELVCFRDVSKGRGGRRANLFLISAMHRAFPSLVAEIRALRERVAELEDTIALNEGEALKLSADGWRARAEMAESDLAAALSQFEKVTAERDEARRLFKAYLAADCASVATDGVHCDKCQGLSVARTKAIETLTSERDEAREALEKASHVCHTWGWRNDVFETCLEKGTRPCAGCIARSALRTLTPAPPADDETGKEG